MDVDFDPELAPSDDEFDDIDNKHDQLVAAIVAGDNKRSKKGLRRRVAATEDEARLAKNAGKKVDTPSRLGKEKKDKALEQVTKTVKSENLVPTPLHKHELKQLEREVAYKEVKKEVSKWDPIVKQNRAAETLEFPTQSADIKITSESYLKRFNPRTPLDKDIASLLMRRPLDDSKPLTKAEERARRAFDLKVATERRATLKRYQELMRRQEAKARYKKKIKSKRYHRALRKEKERVEQKELEELQQKDPEAFLEKMQLREKERIKERASLKHKGTSKKMKKAAIYGKFDEAAREMIQEMNQKGRELSQKNVVEESESEGESSDEDGEEKGTPSANPWMGVIPQNYIPEPAAAQEEVMEEDNKEEEEDHDQQFETVTKKRKRTVEVEETVQEVKKRKGNKQKAVKLQEAPVELSSDYSDSEVEEEKTKEDEANIYDHSDIGPSVGSSKRLRTLEDFSGELSEEETEKEENRQRQLESAAAAAKQSKQKTGPKTGNKKEVDPRKVMTAVPVRDLEGDAGVLVDEEDEPEVDSQRMSIKAAFVDDDVVGEFEEEKRKTADAQKPKDIEMALPGWGSWVKPDKTTVSKRIRKRFTIKAPELPRKDAMIKGVIISENKDNSIAKHQVKSLPPGFTNVHQFRYTIAQPIGREWNTESAFQKFIAPKVKTKLGGIIEPINKKDTFKHIGERNFTVEDSKNKRGKKRRNRKNTNKSD